MGAPHTVYVQSELVGVCVVINDRESVHRRLDANDREVSRDGM